MLTATSKSTPIHTQLDEFIKSQEDLVAAARIEGILLDCIRRHEFIYYIDIAKMLGMFSGGRHLARLLGVIHSNDRMHKEPIKTSIVISKGRDVPGYGHYVLDMEWKSWTTLEQYFDDWKGHLTAFGMHATPLALKTIDDDCKESAAERAINIDSWQRTHQGVFTDEGYER